MPVPGLDPNKCHSRNHVAAKRDGINAAPVRFLKSGTVANTEATSARGTLPKTESEALARINANRADGATPLTSDDVYIHYLEAANNSFVGDRYMFLGASTLKNIAKDAEQGFAFMNSHRTGGLSHPSELPFGRTFTGRYEQSGTADDGLNRRALVGFYMLRGEKPNGDSGPSTDTLHRSIDAGTLFDVSVGLHGGKSLCDVCGQDIRALVEDDSTWSGYSYLCPHVPGTTEAMSEDEKAAQLTKGVPGGAASYTLFDSHCGEVSAVYDGAVTGAGFQKALAFARQGALSPTATVQARSAYSALSGKGELFTMPIDEQDMEEQLEPWLRTQLRKHLPSMFGTGTHGAPNTPESKAPVLVVADDKEGLSTANPAEDHPVLKAALAAGVTTSDEFSVLTSRSERHEDLQSVADNVFSEAVKDAEKQAIRCFGQTDGPAKVRAWQTATTRKEGDRDVTEYTPAPFTSSSQLADVRSMAKLWGDTANAKFGITSDKPAERKTQSDDPAKTVGNGEDKTDYRAEAKGIVRRTARRDKSAGAGRRN